MSFLLVFNPFVFCPAQCSSHLTHQTHQDSVMPVSFKIFGFHFFSVMHLVSLKFSLARIVLLLDLTLFPIKWQSCSNAAPSALISPSIRIKQVLSSLIRNQRGAIVGVYTFNNSNWEANGRQISIT